MQFKVPQDVQQADRIVSFLTLQQLIMCVVGGGTAYAVYTILSRQGLPFIFWIFPVGVILLITAAFAFLKIANLPFYRYLALLVERMIMPSRRVWIKGADRVISDEDYISPEELKAKEKEEKEKALIEGKEEQLKNIGTVSDLLDTEKKKEAELHDLDETSDQELLQKAFVEKPKQQEVKEPENKVLEMSAPVLKKRRRKRKRKNMSGIFGTSASGLPLVPATAPKASVSPPPAVPPTALEPDAPVAPENQITIASPTAIEEVPEEPLVIQEKEELMIPEKIFPPAPASTPVIEPAPKATPLLQKQGEFTADQLKAGATLHIPNS